MSDVNLEFIHANILRAGELRIPINVMFSEGLVKTMESWKSTLRMEPIAAAIALLNNIVATTLEFRYVSPTADDRCQIPLNMYNIIVARSCTHIFFIM